MYFQISDRRGIVVSGFCDEIEFLNREEITIRTGESEIYVNVRMDVTYRPNGLFSTDEMATLLFGQKVSK